VPIQANYAESVWHLYVIRASNRDELQTFLSSQGIATGLHYPVPIHLQPAYSELGYGPGSFPLSERYADEVLSLPMYPELTDEMIERVAHTIKSVELLTA
jgi:dTDP-4-amino-4,6-dideoxygalactose transaminase